MKHYSFGYLLFSALIGANYAAVAPKIIICNQDYALCTSAACVPDPRHANYALCSCVIEKGNSAGYTSCAKRMPKQGQFKTKYLVSTFSFEQFNSKKSMVCSKGMPWTNCVDAPCTVNPLEPNKALCSCAINYSQSFVTFGGECNVATCVNGFWSGATISTSHALRQALSSTLKIMNNPWPNMACPLTTK